MTDTTQTTRTEHVLGVDDEFVAVRRVAAAMASPDGEFRGHDGQRPITIAVDGAATTLREISMGLVDAVTNDGEIPARPPMLLSLTMAAELVAAIDCAVEFDQCDTDRDAVAAYYAALKSDAVRAKRLAYKARRAARAAADDDREPIGTEPVVAPDEDQPKAAPEPDEPPMPADPQPADQPAEGEPVAREFEQCGPMPVYPFDGLVYEKEEARTS